MADVAIHANFRAYIMQYDGANLRVACAGPDHGIPVCMLTAGQCPSNRVSDESLPGVWVLDDIAVVTVPNGIMTPNRRVNRDGRSE